MIETKEYLGDSVYAEIEMGMIKLTTHNGMRTTNMIFLESETWGALVAYVDRAVIAHKKAAAAAVAAAVVRGTDIMPKPPKPESDEDRMRRERGEVEGGS